MSENNLEKIMEAVRSQAANHDLSALPSDFSAEFNITDAGVFSITVPDGKLNVLPQSHSNPDIKVTTTIDVLKKISNKQLDVKMAFLTKKISLQGDLKKALSLLKIFKN